MSAPGFLLHLPSDSELTCTFSVGEFTYSLSFYLFSLLLRCCLLLPPLLSPAWHHHHHRSYHHHCCYRHRRCCRRQCRRAAIIPITSIAVIHDYHPRHRFVSPFSLFVCHHVDDSVTPPVRPSCCFNCLPKVLSPRHHLRRHPFLSLPSATYVFAPPSYFGITLSSHPPCCCAIPVLRCAAW